MSWIRSPRIPDAVRSEAKRVARRVLGGDEARRFRLRRVEPVRSVVVREILEDTEAERPGRVGRTATLFDGDPSITRFLQHTPLARIPRATGYRSGPTDDLPEPLARRVGETLRAWSEESGAPVGRVHVDLFGERVAEGTVAGMGARVLLGLDGCTLLHRQQSPRRARLQERWERARDRRAWWSFLFRPW